MACKLGRNKYKKIKSKNKVVLKRTKLKMYQTLLRPILTYAVKTMTMIKEGEKMLFNLFEKFVQKMRA